MRIHHVTFISSELNRSREFYEGVLGLTPNLDRPTMSFAGSWYNLGQNQQIHLMQLPNPEAEVQRPIHAGRDRHLALVVSDLAQLIVRLEAAGIVYTPSQSGRRAVFCRDPDGNALEFTDS